MTASVESRVMKGAAFLDERYPGWARQINLESLRMKSLANCILGQLYGSYFRGYDRLGIADDTMAVQHGFWAVTTREAPYLRLQKFWVIEVTKRISQE